MSDKNVSRPAPYTRPTGTPVAEPLKIGVLISGSGTNLQALIDRIAEGSLNASIELVVSSRADAYGIKRAEEASIETLVMSREDYADPVAADQKIVDALLERGVEYVVMAGYMRMVRTPMLRAFENVVNLHPALLPRLCRARMPSRTRSTVASRCDGRDRSLLQTRCTTAAPSSLGALPIEEEWTSITLESHIHDIEAFHPEAVQMLADGRVHVLWPSRVAIDPVPAA